MGWTVTEPATLSLLLSVREEMARGSNSVRTPILLHSLGSTLNSSSGATHCQPRPQRPLADPQGLEWAVVRGIPGWVHSMDCCGILEDTTREPPQEKGFL